MTAKANISYDHRQGVVSLLYSFQLRGFNGYSSKKSHVRWRNSIVPMAVFSYRVLIKEKRLDQWTDKRLQDQQIIIIMVLFRRPCLEMKVLSRSIDLKLHETWMITTTFTKSSTLYLIVIKLTSLSVLSDQISRDW